MSMPNCSLVQKFGPLIGRILLSVIFIIAGWGKIGGFEKYASGMFDMGLPFSQVLLLLTIIIELGGGLLILLGWQARWAALAIFLFIIPVSIIYHPFWADPAEFNSFFKNLAIMGGMLYIVTYGSGPYSLSKS